MKNPTRFFATLMFCALAVGVWGASAQVGRSAKYRYRSAVRTILPPQSQGAGMQVGAASAADPAGADIELIRQRLKVEFSRPNNPNASREGREPNFSRIHEVLASQAADGHWDDVAYVDRKPATAGAYSNPSTPNFHSSAHLNRLVQMTGSYVNAASPDYHSPNMLEGIAHGLAYWYKNHPISDNWWNNTIGDPLLLSRVLVPLEDDLPADVLREGLTYYSSPSEIFPTYATGENLVWYAQQQVLRGALARYGQDIAAGSAAMQREIRISAGEGIQRDFSFHQHGPQLYNGGYGHDFIIDTCKYATILEGTRYALKHEKLALLADFFLDGDGSMIRGKMLDYSAFGRTLLRRDAAQGASDFPEACQELAALLPERAPELLALKAHIEGTGKAYSYLGNRYYWDSDFMTHQREGYYISVKMVSNRTVGTEVIHAENMHGGWLPFGTTWILRRGDEYATVLPIFDWGRLPGVTSPNVPPATVREVRQPESFVGGVTDGTYGAAAMVFEETSDLPLVPRLNISTKGRKAWFFFDGEMVALGTGITSTADEPVGTTLNQTLLHGSVLISGHAAEPGESKVAQGAWVLHDEIGYTFLAPADARVKIESQSASTRGPGPASPASESVFTLWIDHGIRPHDAQYAYAVVPGVDAEHLADWMAHPPVVVVSNTSSLQAVINRQAGVAEIVFHTPGRVTLAAGRTVEVDRHCLVLLTRRGNSTRVSVSSPGGEFSTVHLTITAGQKSKALTFELPDGDRAGESRTLEVAGSFLGIHLPSAGPSK